MALGPAAANVATNEEVIFFDGDEKGVVLGGNKDDCLSYVLVDVERDRLTVGLMARALCFIP